MRAPVPLLLLAALAGCGRDPLAVPDGSALNRRTGARDGREPIAEGQQKSDACVPLTCDSPACFPAYCGVIGDGCGGMLDCGGCAAGWSCKQGQCFPDVCKPITCDTAKPFPYCGVIGDGCGRSLTCTCPNPTWTCIDRVCHGGSECAPIPGCITPWGDEYCGGFIGDACGGVLDCRRECSRPGFVCRANACTMEADAGSFPVPPPPLPVTPTPPTAPPPPCPPPPLP
jgi:hypothetical protein